MTSSWSPGISRIRLGPHNSPKYPTYLPSIHTPEVFSTLDLPSNFSSPKTVVCAIKGAAIGAIARAEARTARPPIHRNFRCVSIGVDPFSHLTNLKERNPTHR